MERPIPVEMVFPEKGTAQGFPLAKQPPGTCANLRNVRSVDWRDRKGGGKRPGHFKAISSIAGTAASRRLSGLCLYLPATPSQLGPGTQTLVNQSFNTGTYAVSADPQLDGNWILVRDSLWTSTPWTADTEGTSGNLGSDIGPDSGATINTLRFGGGNGLHGTGIICMFGTTNDTTCDVIATGAVGVAETAVEQCTRIGPCVRFGNKGESGLYCWLRQNGVNSVTLQIVEITTGRTQNILATSAPAATSGAAGLTTYTLRLRIDPADNLLTATCSGALTMSIKASAVQSALYLGQIRGGVVCNAPSAVAGTNYRLCGRCSLTKLVPATPAIVQDLATPVGKVLDWSGTITPGAFQFRIPDGAYARSQTTTTGADSTAELLYTAPTASVAAADSLPRIDTTNDRIGFGFSAGARSYWAAANPVAYRTSVRFFLRSDSPATPLTASQDSIGALWYMSADRKAWFGVTEFNRRVGTTVAHEGRLQNDIFGTVRVNARLSTGAEVIVSTLITNNALIRRDPPTATIPQLNIWSFDGTTLSLTINGLLMHSVVLARDTDGSYTDLTGFGVVLNAIRTNTGFGMTVGITSGVLVTEGFGGYIVTATPPGVDYSQFKATILEASTGAFTIGDLTANTQLACTGAGLFGALPQLTVAFGRWYGCDGFTFTVVDPVTAVSAPWVASAGTLPAGAQYICTYRGRVVLAFGTQWFMSRAGDPLDWAYNTAPLATSAYTGNDANFGGPADVITSLIPFGDDYCLFGCAQSIWRMDGDPGYQGLITCLTRKTGILGPRSYCFDEKGNLYFLGGGGGLFVLPRGAMEPENVSNENMAAYFDRQDFSANLVMMGYDAFRREVRIYVTAADGSTNNVHAIYRPADNAFWLDSIPLSHGPWAVCDGVGTHFWERTVILGGADGYIRRPDPRANSDDGDAIDAWIEIGPFEWNNGQEESMVVELQGFVGAGSEVMTWYWFTGRSAEEVAAQDFPSAVATGSWGGAAQLEFQTPVGLRQTGGAHKIRVRSNTGASTWSLERIVAYFRPTGRRRSSSSQV